jgi:predicted nuclease with RNAse H fold
MAKRLLALNVVRDFSQRGMQVPKELLEKIAVIEVLTIECTIETIPGPRDNVVGKPGVRKLTRLHRGGRKSLKKRMTGIN